MKPATVFVTFRIVGDTENFVAAWHTARQAQQHVARLNGIGRASGERLWIDGGDDWIVRHYYREERVR